MRTRSVISLSLLASLLLLGGGCSNPFAPKLDPNLSPTSSLLGNQRTVEGVFRNIQYAYNYRDTLIYGNLLHPDFQFKYYNSDRLTDVTINRDEEMRITYNLFNGADQLDFQWNEIVTEDGDSLQMSVSRRYHLKVAPQANEVFRIDGRATLRLVRNSPNDVWLITLWRDESNI